MIRRTISAAFLCAATSAHAENTCRFESMEDTAGRAPFAGTAKIAEKAIMLEFDTGRVETYECSEANCLLTSPKEGPDVIGSVDLSFPSTIVHTTVFLHQWGKEQHLFITALSRVTECQEAG